MSQHFGGKVEKASHREYGKAEIDVKNPTALFGQLPTRPSSMDESWRPCNCSSRRIRSNCN